MQNYESARNRAKPRFGPGGGHWPRKGVWGCAAVMTPFFQANQRSLAYQFTTNVPLMCPPFSIFRKFCIFSLVLAKISALKTQIFQIFVPKTPYFSRKIRSLDPTFENRVAHTHQKKSWVPPPPGRFGHKTLEWAAKLGFCLANPWFSHETLEWV